jgi:hypothetical protein
VDDKEKYIRQAIYLVWSLTKLAGVSRDNIILHYTGNKIDPRLYKLDVEIVPVSPFQGHPWCNKLQQFNNLSKIKFDELVLLDCDLAILEEPPVSDSIMAKPVNYGFNPPLAILIDMFEELNLLYEIIDADIDGKTIKGNVNGGVYTMNKNLFNNIYQTWYDLALWCLDRENMFGEYYKYIDQISFAMALAKNNVKYEKLNRKYNFSIHPWMKEELDCLPSIIHYNWFYDDKHMLQPMREGFKNANKVIDFLNNKWNENL